MSRRRRPPRNQAAAPRRRLLEPDAIRHVRADRLNRQRWSIASGDVGTLWVYPSDTGTLRTTDGYFTDSGQTFITGLTGGAVSWQAPSVDIATEVQFTLLDARTGDVTATSSITVRPASGGGSVAATETQAASVQDDGTGGSLVTTLTAEATQAPESGGTNGAARSDGTAGPQLPPGSDGTGGIRQITLP